MKCRVARHTGDMVSVVRFYKDILGLELLGGFKDHDGYDGVFLGMHDAGWHLEFTVSADKPVHQADEDDLLVFYFETETALQLAKERFRENGISEVLPKNPYWRTNGTCYKDPDGFHVIISLAPFP